jgi:hypothetical protein
MLVGENSQEFATSISTNFAALAMTHPVAAPSGATSDPRHWSLAPRLEHHGFSRSLYHISAHAHVAGVDG